MKKSKNKISISTIFSWKEQRKEMFLLIIIVAFLLFVILMLYILSRPSMGHRELFKGMFSVTMMIVTVLFCFFGIGAATYDLAGFLISKKAVAKYIAVWKEIAENRTKEYNRAKIRVGLLNDQISLNKAFEVLFEESIRKDNEIIHAYEKYAREKQHDELLIFEYLMIMRKRNLLSRISAMLYNYKYWRERILPTSID